MSSPTPGPERQDRTTWPRWLRWLPVILLLVATNWWLSTSVGPPEGAQVSYSFFVGQLEAGNVAEVTTQEDVISGSFRQAVRYPPTGTDRTQVTDFTTDRPTFAQDDLVDRLLAKGVTVTSEPAASPSLFETVLVYFGPTLLLVGLLVWFLRRSARQGGIGGLGGLGKSRAHLYQPSAGPRTTFADVAGIDEVAAEVREVVDFLKSPERYRRLGASIPKGVLLTGEPGTGKTLLARALAGEADVPFFHLSASEFIEMIVGVGASRVRDLFEQAKKAAPSIIFIDELDAVGRTRGSAGYLGGHDEREQTLNQILTEMDGFSGNEGVVVLAATNRPEILDPALLRAGRFDRKIHINPPDRTGREQILRVHTRGVPVAEDVDVGALASETAGMVGADLKNLVNEAALLAAKSRHDRVTTADFTGALEKVVLGTARRVALSVAEKERTAFHEAGHALLGMAIPGADRVRKVSIIPRGQALGATLSAPEDERHYFPTAYLRGRMIGALGGRAAEELVYGDVTTGAESDLELVTALARQMVGRWGMSPAVGPVTVLPAPGAEQTMLDPSGPSAGTRDLLDAEVRRIIDDCYAQALATLREYRPNLDRLAHRLVEVETLDEHEAYLAAGLPSGLAPPVTPPGTSPVPG